MSKASKFVKREIGKLVRKEGKKSSMKMGDAIEFGALLADKVYKDEHSKNARLVMNIYEWGRERAAKKILKSRAKTRKAK